MYIDIDMFMCANVMCKIDGHIIHLLRAFIFSEWHRVVLKPEFWNNAREYGYWTAALTFVDLRDKWWLSANRDFHPVSIYFWFGNAQSYLLLVALFVFIPVLKQFKCMDTNLERSHISHFPAYCCYPWPNMSCRLSEVHMCPALARSGDLLDCRKGSSKTFGRFLVWT